MRVSRRERERDDDDDAGLYGVVNADEAPEMVFLFARNSICRGLGCYDGED